MEETAPSMPVALRRLTAMPAEEGALQNREQHCLRQSTFDR